MPTGRLWERPGSLSHGVSDPQDNFSMRICSLGLRSVCGLVLNCDLGMVLFQKRTEQAFVAGMCPDPGIPTLEESHIDGKLLGSARWWKGKGFAPRAFTVSLVIKSMCLKLSSWQPPSGVLGRRGFHLACLMSWFGGRLKEHRPTCEF